MKSKIIQLLLKQTSLAKEELENLLSVPPSQQMGDYAFPCFTLAKKLQKSPIEIAKELAKKFKEPYFEKVEAVGPYVNFFLNRKEIAKDTLLKIFKEKDKYGFSSEGKGKTLVIDMSSPNIAKPFGIGHLRSTIIGNAITNLARTQGWKVVRINYLGDWGTQFGKLITGYKHWGDAKKLKENPLAHLQDLYVKVNQDSKYEAESREWFLKLEQKDKEALKLWEQFKSISWKEFEKIYKLLGIEFEVISGESEYNDLMDLTVKLLERKSILKKDQGAQIVDLNEHDLGVCLIKKSDGATLYATRDITAAIDRYKKYSFDQMIYEVGAEQKLHFKQVFKILELLDFSWAKKCTHVDHGLYLDSDGKKFSTRKGKVVYLAEILQETTQLAENEVSKRYSSISQKEIQMRAKAIAISAIFYGDLKNYRSNDMIFDIDRFVSFEGDTGPYLLYSYARAKSILEKAKYDSKNKYSLPEFTDLEKKLILELAKFPSIVQKAHKDLAPNLIAGYAFNLSQTFNEFYHNQQVIGSENEFFRLSLVSASAQVLKNALAILGIPVLEKM